MPNYLVSYSDHKIVLRNYEGYITTYEEPPSTQPHDKAHCRRARTRGPSRARRASTGLLEGKRMWIEPKGFERGPHARHRRDAPPQGPGQVGALRRRRHRGPGDGAGRGAAGARGRRRGVRGERRQRRGAKQVYGPGEEPRPAEGAPTAHREPRAALGCDLRTVADSARGLSAAERGVRASAIVEVDEPGTAARRSRLVRYGRAYAHSSSRVPDEALGLAVGLRAGRPGPCGGAPPASGPR